MVVKEIRPRVFLLTTDNRKDLAYTFLRFQEFYENPNPRFKGKKFTFDQFRKWYARNRGKKGKFTYAADWSGFNLPSHAIYKAASEMKPLSKREQALVDDLPDDAVFYVIGTLKGDIGTLKHELAHAFWYVSPKYKHEAQMVMKRYYPELKKLKHKLIKTGMYHEEVLEDEIHAYLLESRSPRLKGARAAMEKVFSAANAEIA